MKTRWLLLAALSLLGPGALAQKRGNVSEPLEVHPKVFHLVDSWVSDSEAPVVTEINLDAVKADGNQFNRDDVKKDGDWLRCDDAETHGFFRYRVVQASGNTYKVEYQENGGGSLTTAALIGCAIERREIRMDGKPVTIRVLRITSFATK